MSNQKSNQNVSTSSENAFATTTSSNAIHPRRRIYQNFSLIWLDVDIDQSKDCQNTLALLQTVVNDVNIFTQQDECINFLTEVDDMKAFLILGSTLGSQIIPLIHNIPQLHSIYIFSDNKFHDEQWAKEWIKIKGMHTDIKSICKALQLATKQSNQDSIAVSFVTPSEMASNANLNQLEPLFMYTQIFKAILLEMEHNEQSFKNFVLFWRQHYINNTFTLNVIAKFEHDYSAQSSIEWYTRESFIYQMLNRALRMLEADTIINMGFFLRDFHQQLEELHQQQAGSYQGKPFTIYRGQGLSKTDFEKLLKTKGGLMSFNNFLSTSPDRDVSLFFAESALGNTDTIGILFKMSIDPSVSSTPFASIKEFSYFKTEEEILFSMHTVFRIGEITKIGNNSSLYQVNLKLTADDDQELRILTNRIQEEVVDTTGWERLGKLLIKLSQFNKAEELYTVLLQQTSDDCDKALYYHHLGYVKDDQGDYEKDIEYYERALEIWEKALPPSHPDLASSCNNIGGVYDNMGEYSKALLFYERALEIWKTTLPPNHPHLASSYNNIGLVYCNMGEYSKALSFYEKTLEICQNTLPSNHPHLATSYNNIGQVYDNMGEYEKALSFYEKLLEIRQKALLPNHPDLATSYDNIGGMYDNMGEYSKALSFYEKALDIEEKTLPQNHPDLATSYNNIGGVYNNMEEYSKALAFYEKALEICQKTLPPNHPDLATCYGNIGSVYNRMEEYEKALSFYEKSLEIKQKSLPPYHPDLASSYNNIGTLYYDMGEYSKSLSYYEHSLKIWQSSLPPTHPRLKSIREGIEFVKEKL